MRHTRIPGCPAAESLTRRTFDKQISPERAQLLQTSSSASVPRRSHEGRTSPGNSADMVAMYGRGWSGPHIATRSGCSTATVYRRLEAAGVARRGPRPAVDRPWLIEALDAGLSAPDIAARFKVSVSAVCRALTREGLSTLSQTKRRQAAEHYATLLTLGEGSGGADGATVERLRRRVRSSPGRPGRD